MIEGEDYKVVDECMEEETEQSKVEDTATAADDAQVNVKLEDVKEEVQNESSKTVESPQEDGTTEKEEPSDIIENDDAIEKDDALKKDSPVPVTSCEDKYQPVQPVEGSIDFTTDISLDQLDTHKDMTDEEVMHHLDEIENIVLDPATFQLQEQVEKKDSDVETVVKEEAEQQENKMEVEYKEPFEEETEKQVEPVNAENQWYEKKLAEKETTVRERLSKLARVLGFSYPCYEKWLEKMEKTEKTPICKLLPSRKCPLDKPYTNRWKFICE